MTEKALIAHWPLQSDASDIVGHNDGAAQGIAYVQGTRGSVARFDGAASQIVVPASEALRLGNGDFTIAVWARCDQPMRGAFGDILSKFEKHVYKKTAILRRLSIASETFDKLN